MMKAYQSFGSGSLDDIPLTDDDLDYPRPTTESCFNDLLKVLLRLPFFNWTK